MKFETRHASHPSIIPTADTAKLRELYHIGGIFTPALILAGGDPMADDQPALMRNRTAIGGIPTAYVCRGFTCDLPTSDPLAFERQVKRLIGDGVIPEPTRGG